MSERDDRLIAEFNARRSEEAFAALVRQHVNLVFATALRQVGDAGAAEEITQNVFVALAQAAGKLGSHPTIAGWLHQTALNKSREWLRSELRRRRREQVAVNLDLARAEGDSVWSSLVPLLDEALLELREPDRLAVILHFMEGQTFHEVGSALGVGEDAARKRVNRCLGQLTHFFRCRGFAPPTLVAGAPLFTLSSHAAPAGLAASATTAGLAAAHSAASTSTLTLIKGALKIMAWTKAKMAVVGGAVVVLTTITTTVVVKEFVHPMVASRSFAREQERILLPDWTRANSREPESSLLPYWWSQTFVPISHDEKFRAQIQALPLNRECDLTEKQSVALHEAVDNLLMAFNLESYEAYRAFRTPAPARFTFSSEMIEVQKRYLRNDWKNPTKEVPADPEDIFHRYWEVVYLNKYVNDSGAVKYSTIGKSLWAGVSLKATNTEIVVEELTSRSDLEKYVSSRKGNCRYSSSFKFENTPDNILQQCGHVKFATVKCLIKYAEPELSNPVYCRYYWDENASIWLPFDLGIGISGLRRTRDLVF